MSEWRTAAARNILLPYTTHSLIKILWNSYVVLSTAKFCDIENDAVQVKLKTEAQVMMIATTMMIARAQVMMMATSMMIARVYYEDAPLFHYA